VARAPQDSALLRVFVGGAFGREWFEKDDKDLVPLVQKELAQVLGISGAPLFSVIRRYPRSMVQYEVGHARWLAEIELELEKSPRLYLTGSSYRGVGIPDAVCDAEFQAERIYSHSREGGNRP
jgi:protoporphyrinogen/coproporphyrinogen III oxidase